MATAIQRRRGSSAQHANFTGLAGEITIDTTLNTIIVHDGVTEGGIRLAKHSEVVSASEGDITAVNTIAGGGLTGGVTSGAANLSLDYENMQGNLVPAVDNVYSLGTAEKVWKDVFVGPGSLYVNGQKVLEDNAGTITVGADAGQNLALTTSGGGDIEFNTVGGGTITLKSNVVLAAGVTMSSAGGDATGFNSNINMENNQINNVGAPVSSSDAATKGYVDTATDIVRTSGDQTIAGSKTFSGDMSIGGSLTVTGTVTTVNSETISLADNLIDLNSNFTSGAPTENAGLKVKRGDEADVQLRWNEADDEWQFTNDGATYKSMASIADVLGSISAGGDLAYNSTTGEVSFTERTDAEVRGLISAGGDLAYNSTTGTVSFTERTDAQVRALVGASGDMSYDSDTGIFSYSTPSTIASLSNHDTDDLAEGTNQYFTAARARAAISAEGDISYNPATGVISFTNDAGDIESVQAGAGLTGGGASGSVTLNVGQGTGITVSADAIAVDMSAFDTTDLSEGDNLYYTSARAQADANVAIQNNSTDNVSEGDSNLYYTSARVNSAFDTRLGNKSTTDLSEGDNLYYTSARANSAFDTRLGTKSTTDLSEGTNLYYTSARAQADANIALAANTTDNVTEGDNLYFTEDRARGALSGGGDISYNSTTGHFSVTTYKSTDFDTDFGAKSTTDLTEGDNLYYTDARAQAAITVSGDLTKDAGEISFTERTDAEVRALLSSGTGISYNSTTGAISVNSTIATKDYADSAASSAVAAVIDSAPGTLDTLNELAAALGDDANFATTITNSLADKYDSADFNGDWDARLITKTTDNLAEGASNLYYTTPRARSAISATGDLSYNSTTGVMSYTGRTDAGVRALFSAGGNLAYNSTTGQFSVTTYKSSDFDDDFDNKTTDDLSEGASNLYHTTARVRSSVSASGDLNYNSTTGVFSISLPASDNYQSWTITDGTVAENVGSGSTIEFAGSGATSTSYNATTNTLTIGSTDTVDYINNASFSTSTGVLSLSGVGRASASVDLDGRYQIAGSYVTTTSAQALHPTDALSVSGDTITLTKADGTTESVTIADNDAQTLGWNGTTGVISISGGNSVDLDGRYELSGTNTTDYISNASFNGTTGVLTLSGVGQAGATVDLDGRYQLAGSFVTTNSAQALRASDAIQVSNDTITIFKGDGTSESVTISDAYENYGSWTVSDGTNSEAIGSGATLSIEGSGATSTSYDAATNTLTISSVDTNTNSVDYINGASFNSTNGVLTLSGVGNAGASVDLDGRYQLAGSYQPSGSYVTTTSAQALRATDAVTVSNDTITIHKGDGTSESVSISDANTWRPIDDTPVNGVTDQSISSNWAFDHQAATGAGIHGSTTAATANRLAHRDSSGNLTASVFIGQATSARYADLAEKYATDAELEAGTVVVFGGDAEVTACSSDAHHAVAGVISTDPAYMMNSEAEGQYVALTGRVPVKVTGPVAKGDLMVTSSVAGHAKADNNAQAGRILGKAISSHQGEGEGVVEVLITLM